MYILFRSTSFVFEVPSCPPKPPDRLGVAPPSLPFPRVLALCGPPIRGPCVGLLCGHVWASCVSPNLQAKVALGPRAADSKFATKSGPGPGPRALGPSGPNLQAKVALGPASGPWAPGPKFASKSCPCPGPRALGPRAQICKQKWPWARPQGPGPPAPRAQICR